MEIKDKRDEKFLILIIKLCPERNDLPTLKRKVRRWQKRKSDRVVFNAEYDSWTELIECPSYVTDMESAEEWFEYNEKRIAYPSQYDCTGQLFTHWHKFVKRNGKWFCYHRILMDV